MYKIVNNDGSEIDKIVIVHNTKTHQAYSYVVPKMKIIVEYKDNDDHWQDDTLEIAPLGWPEFYLHNRYSTPHISIRDADWGKIHLMIPLEFFHATFPEVNFSLYGNDAEYFYTRYIKECQRRYNEIVETQKLRMFKAKWIDIKLQQPDIGKVCFIARKEQHEIRDNEYPGWVISKGTYDKHIMFQTSRNSWEGADLWKYETDVYY